MDKRKFYNNGLRDGIPIFIGYLAVSFSFGIQAKKFGLTVLESGFLSLSNLTSAGQFAGLTMMFGGATLLEIAISQLIINSRYLLMSGALSQKLSPDESLPKRLLMAHGITDEMFAMSISEPNTLSPFYHYGLMSAAIPGWVMGTVLGVLAGDLLPTSIIDALGIALYGMLIAVIVPPAKNNKVVASLIIISMILSYVVNNIPILKNISPSMMIIILTIIITTIASYFFPVEEANHEI